MRLWLRGALDLALYFTKCLGIFHRAVRRELGPYAPPYGDDMVCLRCGSTWASDE